MTQCESWRAAVAEAEMVSDIPMFPRDSFADRSVGFLPLISTEATRMKKREMESERISRTIWKVWGELQNKWSKIEKAGNIIIKLSVIGNTCGEEGKRCCAQLSLDKMFYYFWLSSPVETICQALLLIHQDYLPSRYFLLNWCVVLHHVNSAFIFSSYCFLVEPKRKLLNYCQKMHCIWKGYLFLSF